MVVLSWPLFDRTIDARAGRLAPPRAGPRRRGRRAARAAACGGRAGLRGARRLGEGAARARSAPSTPRPRNQAQADARFNKGLAHRGRARRCRSAAHRRADPARGRPVPARPGPCPTRARHCRGGPMTDDVPPRRRLIGLPSMVLLGALGGLLAVGGVLYMRAASSTNQVALAPAQAGHRRRSRPRSRSSRRGATSARSSRGCRRASVRR